MRRFYIYEGTQESRDSSDSFDSKREAITRAKITVDNARGVLPNYIAHVIDSKTGEFVHTESFNFY